MNARTFSLSFSVAGWLMLAGANAQAGGYGWVGDVMGMGMGTSASGQPLGGTASQALRRNAPLSSKVAQLTNNLGVPFDKLKQRIMAGQSLGEAVHALRPDTDAQVEARKARASAQDDIRRS